MSHLHIYFRTYQTHSVNRIVKREIQEKFLLLLSNMIISRIFFPSAIIEWNKLDCYIKNSDSFAIFKKRILEFIRPKPNSIFNIQTLLGLNTLQG